jgi:preprotein translocase subunit SecA
VEYQREGFDMFNAMLDGIKEESVGFLFNLEVHSHDEQEAEARAQQEAAEAAALAAAHEGTARVLARQAAEAEAASAATATAAGNGKAVANGKAAANGSARATGQVPSARRAAAPALDVKGLAEERRASTEGLTYSAPTLDASAKDAGAAKAAKTATVSGTKTPARNAPCPCGSGKKYKFCHGAAG